MSRPVEWSAIPGSNNGIVRPAYIARRDRSLDWLSLLPHETHLTVEQAVPAPTRHKLTEISGTGEPSLVAYRNLEAPHGLNGFGAVAVIDPAPGVASSLEAHGFQHILQFTAVPSLDNPRVLVPIGNRRVTVGSLDLLAPYKLAARIKKSALTGLARLGAAHRVGDTLLLARRQVSALESYFQTTTGQDALYFALSPGAEGEFRKLTFRLTGVDGRAIGIAKVGWTDAARDAINRECRMLDHLARSPELRDHIPSLMGATSIAGQVVSVQSAGGMKVSGSEYDAHHDAFLKTLALASAQRMRFSESTMWRTIKAMHERLVPRLPDERREQIECVIEEVDLALGARELVLSIAHRDFGPWNVRLQPTGEVFVFDWETAQPEMVPGYDFFDFHARSHVLYGKQAQPAHLAGLWISRCRHWYPELPASDVPAFFLAYLLDRTLSRSRYELWRGDAQRDPMLELLVAMLDSRASWMTS